MPEPDAQRLRQYVARARARQGFRDNTDVAEAAGVKYRTLVNLLAGKPTRAEDAVELALGWGAGSIQAVLAGGEPTVTEENSGRQVQVDRPSVGAEGEGREPYLTRRGPEEPDLSTVSTDALLEEIARRARDRNPDATR
jgi:hypothetical protein